MHELGIVFYIIRDVKQVAAENNADHVSTVVMNIGEVTTIVPEYLQDCWRWAADKEDLLKGCTLRINTVEAVTLCQSCHREYGTLRHGKICPHCGSEDTVLLQGNEVEIKEIEV
jgi:hydrogenase nickel incorporation protein HypA/HybF